MKKVLLTLSALFFLSLSANAYTYQWNVPYDNYGIVYPNNISGGYYYAGRMPEYAKPKADLQYNNSLLNARNKPRHKHKRYSQIEY